MTYYFSIFLPVREGGYAIFFPDFPEIASEGETVDECMVMAQDALSITVEEYAKARRQLPAPSTLEQVQAVAQKELEDETVDASRCARYGYDPGAHQHQPPQVRAGGAGPQGQRPGNDPLGAHRQGCTGVYVTG